MVVNKSGNESLTDEREGVDPLTLRLFYYPVMFKTAHGKQVYACIVVMQTQNCYTCYVTLEDYRNIISIIALKNVTMTDGSLS